MLELGASSVVLGLVPLAYAVPYSLTAATAGRISVRWPSTIRITLTRPVVPRSVTPPASVTACSMVVPF